MKPAQQLQNTDHWLLAKRTGLIGSATGTGDNYYYTATTTSVNPSVSFNAANVLNMSTTSGG